MIEDYEFVRVLWMVGAVLGLIYNSITLSSAYQRTRNKALNPIVRVLARGQYHTTLIAELVFLAMLAMGILSFTYPIPDDPTATQLATRYLLGFVAVALGAQSFVARRYRVKVERMIEAQL